MLVNMSRALLLASFLFFIFYFLIFFVKILYTCQGGFLIIVFHNLRCLLVSVDVTHNCILFLKCPRCRISLGVHVMMIVSDLFFVDESLVFFIIFHFLLTWYSHFNFSYLVLLLLDKELMVKVTGSVRYFASRNLSLEVEDAFLSFCICEFTSPCCESRNTDTFQVLTLCLLCIFPFYWIVWLLIIEKLTLSYF